MEINNNYEFPMVNVKVAELLGKSYNSIKGYKRNYKNELIKGEDYWSTSDPRFGWTTGPALTVWSQKGTIKLALHCKSDEAGIFLERMNVRTRHISHVESPSIRNIIAAIEGFTRYKRQYLVYAYKVDLYLLDWKIAVECDERDHQNYSNWKDEARQRIIEDCLNCRFVRFNPNAENFLIGQVINEIFATHFGRESFPSV